ncbi:hypothetical protein A2U01_0050286, partial [Trifolium medium]|nr:hypothetical protein [Trifolium medium]
MVKTKASLMTETINKRGVRRPVGARLVGEKDPTRRDATGVMPGWRGAGDY